MTGPRPPSCAWEAASESTSKVPTVSVCAVPVCGDVAFFKKNCSRFFSPAC